MSLNLLTKRLIVGLFILLSGILLASLPGCASKEVEPADHAIKLNAMLMAELALKRNQNKQAYDYFDQAIEAGLSTADYAQLLASLRAPKHQNYRELVISRWYEQHPDNIQALTAYTRLAVCNDSTSALPDLLRLVEKLDKKTHVESLLDCLNPEAKIALLAELADQSGAEEIRTLYCEALAGQEQHSEVLNCIQLLDSETITPRALQLQAQSLMALGQLRAAEKTYLRLLEKSPVDSNSRYELAGLYYEKGQYQEAIEQLDILLETEPNNRNVHYLLASSFYSSEQYLQSRVWFEELLKVRRYRNSALYYLGMIAIELDQTEQALGLLDSVTESEFYLPAQLNLWRIISDSDTDLAIEGLYQLMETLPRERMTIKLAQIDILERAGLDQQATQEVVTLADDFPGNVRLQILRLQWLVERDYLEKLAANMVASLDGLENLQAQQQLVENTVFYLIDQQLGNSAQELLNVQTAIATDSSQFQFFFALAQVLSDEFEPGITTLERFVQANPDSLEYKNALAYSLTLAELRLDEAKQMLTEILQQEPDNAAYLDSMGWLYFKTGQYQEATTYLEKANSRLSSASIKAHLVQLYLQQGLTEQAQRLFSEATELFPRHRAISKLAEITELQPVNE